MKYIDNHVCQELAYLELLSCVLVYEQENPNVAIWIALDNTNDSEVNL